MPPSAPTDASVSPSDPSADPSAAVKESSSAPLQPSAQASTAAPAQPSTAAPAESSAAYDATRPSGEETRASEHAQETPVSRANGSGQWFGGDQIGSFLRASVPFFAVMTLILGAAALTLVLIRAYKRL